MSNMVKEMQATQEIGAGGANAFAAAATLGIAAKQRAEPTAVQVGPSSAAFGDSAADENEIRPKNPSPFAAKLLGSKAKHPTTSSSADAVETINQPESATD